MVRPSFNHVLARNLTECRHLESDTDELPLRMDAVVAELRAAYQRRGILPSTDDAALPTPRAGIDWSLLPRVGFATV